MGYAQGNGFRARFAHPMRLAGLVGLAGSVALLLVVMLALCLPVRAFAAQADTALVSADSLGGGAAQPAVHVQSAKGWVKSAAGKSYYRNGEKLVGLQKIGKHRYYFNKRGIMRTGVVKAGKVTYYLSDAGVLEGAKVGGKYYYNTLKRMSKSDAYDFKTFQKAHAIVRSISKPSDSKAVKLKKAFNWVIAREYGIHRSFSPNRKNWPAIYANDHFDNIGGDCHSDGAAFAYLAAAIGYKADVCLDSLASGYAPSHSWTMIGKKVYDPLFAESKSYSGYYGVTGGTYETNPTARYRVPQYNPKHAKKTAKVSGALTNAGKVGLVYEKGAYYYYDKGSKVKNAWRTVKGKRYYFTSNGKAATYSVKVKGAYYVFDAAGRLQTPSSTKLVTVGSRVYRVAKSGKAVPGWSSDGTMRFDATGQLLCGIKLVGGSLYAASSSGIYDADLTSKLRQAAAKGQPAADLKALLGTPKRTIYSKSCSFAGDDGLWMYDGFAVLTARPSNGEPEYVCKVQAW